MQTSLTLTRYFGVEGLKKSPLHGGIFNAWETASNCPTLLEDHYPINLYRYVLGTRLETSYRERTYAVGPSLKRGVCGWRHLVSL